MTHTLQSATRRPPSSGLPGTRATAGLLTLVGALFVLYSATRPYPVGGSDDGVAEFVSPWWLIAHLAAVIGFIALVPAIAGLRRHLAGTAGERLGGWALGSVGLGVGLTLPYFGSEVFALHAIGSAGAGGRSGLDAATVAGLAQDIRIGGAQLTCFGAGLLLIGVGAVLIAMAIARSGLLPRWSAVPMAVGFAVFIPQFFAAAPIRIAHGVLIGLGCVLVAAALSGADSRRNRSAA